MSSKEKILFFQGLRSIACFSIMLVHFLKIFKPDFLKYWTAGTSSIFLGPFKGKVALALFCVVAGYFSASKVFQMKKNFSFAEFIPRRYLRFMPLVLLVNVFIYLSHFWYSSVGGAYDLESPYQKYLFSAKHLIRDAIYFDGNYNPPLWVLGDLFIGSILVAFLAYYFADKKNRVWGYIFSMLFLIACGKYWLMACVIGLVLRDAVISGLVIMKHKAVLLLCFLAGWFMCQLPQKGFLFVNCSVWYALGAALMIVVIFNVKLMQPVLSLRPLVFLGDISFSMYVWHFPIYKIVPPIMSLVFKIKMSSDSLAGVVFLVSSFCIVGLSCLSEKYIERRLPETVSKLCNRVFS
ncbi:MAG: acyltransferase [Phycisphaerae bacterium]|nr:acyltransferase [Phycisphaerae bacterium]